MTAVEFKKVDIVFGEREAEGLKLLDKGASRSEILEKTGAVLGCAGADLAVKEGEISVLMGLSGSGKSTLAFDVVFAEGQRRYLESLSTYVRQFMHVLPRPDVDHVSGIPPTVAIEQRLLGLVQPPERGVPEGGIPVGVQVGQRREREEPLEAPLSGDGEHGAPLTPGPGAASGCAPGRAPRSTRAPPRGA